MQKIILAVDDNRLIQKMISDILEKAGYRVVTASDGYEALDKVRSVKPDLILLDIEMPGLNGYEVCNRLKCDEECQDIPVIMLTSRSAEKDKMAGLATGVDEYLSKPVQPKELIYIVEEVLELKCF